MKPAHFLIHAALALAAAPSSAETVALHTFQRIQLTDKFWSEAIACGDLNRDGNVDIVSGPFWYEGPAFQKRHAYAPATQTFKRKNADGTEETIEGYEGALGSGVATAVEKFEKVVDLNGDGWPDILVANTKGAFVFLQRVKNVSRQEWEKAQPPVVFPNAP